MRADSAKVQRSLKKMEAPTKIFRFGNPTIDLWNGGLSF